MRGTVLVTTFTPRVKNARQYAINVPHGDIAVDAQPYFPEPLRDLSQ